MEQQNLTPTPAHAWKGKVEVEGTDLALPSGNVARVKPLSPQAFLASGMIPDPISAMIKKAIASKQGLPPSAMKDLADDPKQLAAAMELFDRVLAYVTVEPRILMPPPCSECGEYAITDKHQQMQAEGFHPYNEGEREPGVLYSDMVEMDDKVFVFQWVLGGTRDIERFRVEQRERMESVHDSPSLARPAKRTTRRKK